MKDKYNIIFFDEITYGTVKDFKTYFKDLINEEIKSFTDDDTPSSYNELMATITEYIELLDKINKLYDEELIKVYYNPMGSYNYKKMVEVD